MFYVDAQYLECHGGMSGSVKYISCYSGCWMLGNEIYLFGGGLFIF